MRARRRTGDDGFETSCRRDEQVIRSAFRALGFMVCERHSIERNDFECLSVDLQIQITIRRGVYNAPELWLFRSNLDARANRAVYGKDLFDFLSFSPTSRRWNLNLPLEFGSLRIMLNRATAYDQHALAKSSYFGNITFHSLD